MESVDCLEIIGEDRVDRCKEREDKIRVAKENINLGMGLYLLVPAQESNFLSLILIYLME